MKSKHLGNRTDVMPTQNYNAYVEQGMVYRMVVGDEALGNTKYLELSINVGVGKRVWVLDINGIALGLSQVELWMGGTQDSGGEPFSTIQGTQAGAIGARKLQIFENLKYGVDVPTSLCYYAPAASPLVFTGTPVLKNAFQIGDVTNWGLAEPGVSKLFTPHLAPAGTLVVARIQNISGGNVRARLEMIFVEDKITN